MVRKLAIVVVVAAGCRGDAGSAAPPPPMPKLVLPIAGVAVTPTSRDDQLAREVRERLVGDVSLSVEAKNVTIHVRDGRVTLRGVVASVKEKVAVDHAATAIAGADRVINELDVMP